MKKLRLKTPKLKRKLRVRKKVYGTTERPRLSVFRSNRFIYGQLIDDTKGTTIASARGSVKVDEAFKVGEELGKKAKEAKIKTAVFDKGSYKYHGRVKSFADGARKGGLEF